MRDASHLMRGYKEAVEYVGPMSVNLTLESRQARIDDFLAGYSECYDNVALPFSYEQSATDIENDRLKEEIKKLREEIAHARATAGREVEALRLKLTLLEAEREAEIASNTRAVFRGTHVMSENQKLRETLKLAKLALTHDTPGSCWSTGPMTGNPIEDLVACPGCRALFAIEEALKKGGVAE